MEKFHEVITTFVRTPDSSSGSGSCNSQLCPFCHEYWPMLHSPQESSTECLSSLQRSCKTMLLWTWWLVSRAFLFQSDSTCPSQDQRTQFVGWRLKVGKILLWYWHWGQGVNYPVGPCWVHGGFWNNSPTFYPVDKGWVFLKSTHQSTHWVTLWKNPVGSLGISFKKCPSCAWATCCGFFQKVPTGFISM